MCRTLSALTLGIYRLINWLTGFQVPGGIQSGYWKASREEVSLLKTDKSG